MKKTLKKVLIAAGWIGLWAALSAWVGKEVLLPSPLAAAKSFAGIVATTEFWLSCLYSFIRIISGVVIGTAAGVLLAAVSYKVKLVGDIFSPVLSIIRATPVASFIILALVWIGRGNVPAFTSFLMVLPVVFSSVTVALSGIDRGLLEMVTVFRLPFTKRVSELYFPAAFPAFAGGFRTSLGLAWKAGIAAEVICNPKHGIGSALYDSKIYLETAELFAWTAAVIIISMCLEKLFGAVYARAAKRGGVSA